MKKFIKAIDIIFFILICAVMIFFSAVITIISVFFKRRVRSKYNNYKRLSFAVCDFITCKHPSIMEDTLLNGFFERDYYIYQDYNFSRDRFENVDGRLFIYNFAAHPENILFKSGFCKTSAIFVEVKTIVKALHIAYVNKVDLIVAHDPHILGFNAFLVSRLLKLPFAIHLNSDFDMKYMGTGKTSSSIFFSRSLERFFERFILRSADVIFADRELYAKSKSFPENCVNKYKAYGVRVDDTHYKEFSLRKDLRHELGLKDNVKILLYAGRLHPVKYPRDAIEAFRLAAGKNKNVVLIMIGDGILKGSLEKLSYEYGLNGKVLFLGSKNQAELADLYYTADIFLAPHGGMTLLESALAGTPIIAYDFDWHSEFLRDGIMGYLVPFRDYKVMADKIVYLLENNDELRKMSLYCRKFSFDNYSRKISMENEKNIYRSIIKL